MDVGNPRDVYAVVGAYTAIDKRCRTLTEVGMYAIFFLFNEAYSCIKNAVNLTTPGRADERITVNVHVCCC